MQQSEVLSGGNSNQVIKHGNTVVRKMGVWSPFVHQLLRHLTANGFRESPIILGHTEDMETLSFLDGEVGHYPLKPFMQSDDIVEQAARLLRRFHDHTQGFIIPPDAKFLLPVQEGYEVICHNDFAPYNCVFNEENLAGIIDFDTASPGKRIWDIAYTVYRFTPLATDDHCHQMGWTSIPDKVARLRLFCDAYPLDNRSELMAVVIKRLEALVHYMRETASNLEHIPIYMNDLDYLRENYETFCEAIADTYQRDSS